MMISCFFFKTKHAATLGKPSLPKIWRQQVPLEQAERWKSLRLKMFVVLPSGKRLHNYGTSPFLMGKSTINTPW